MPWLLDELEVATFRGLRSVVLGRLGQVNLIVGSNDAGKTSLLEAIEVLSGPSEPLRWSRPGRRRSLGGRAGATFGPRSLADLRLLFPQAETNAGDVSVAPIELRTKGKHPVEYLRASMREMRGLRPRPFLRSLDSRASEDLDEQRGLAIEVWLRSREALPFEDSFALDFWEHERIISRERGQQLVPIEVLTPHAATEPVRRLSQLRQAQIDSLVVNVLRRFDSNIRAIEILAPEGFPEIYVTDAAAGKLPLSVFGAGLQRALLIALRLPRAAGGILVIDEVEVALHPRALSALFSWLLAEVRAMDIQVFLTTHSLEAVDAILDADTTAEEDVVGFRLDRQRGGTLVKRYGEDLLKRLRRDRGLDIR